MAVGELYYGAYKSGRIEVNRQNVALFVTGRVISNVDSDTGDVYGQIKQALRAKGRPIPDNDIWIAALTIQYGLTLITNDAHLGEVDNLDWRHW